MVTSQTLLRAGAEGDRRAAQMVAGGATLGQIAAGFDPPLSIEQAQAAIARGRHQLNQQAPKPTPVPRPPVVVPVAPQAGQSKRPVPLAVDELLAWAEKDGPARAHTVAARIRAQLAELAQLHEQHAATDVLRKTISVLERQLADAKAELRQTTGAKASPASAGAPSASTSTIRAWALEHGHQVAPIGRVPASVVEAYRAAHAGLAAGS